MACWRATVETDAARSYVTFTLDPAAHFSDGTPVTADGRGVLLAAFARSRPAQPSHLLFQVAKAEILDPRTVRFDFADTSDRELPLILGLMPVLPKHAVDVATFENSTLKTPIGSGPYVVAAVDAGKSVTFKRDPNYWGRDLPINRGLWNFDELRFDFYRDDNAYFEAFKAGLYDVRAETDPTRWQTGYDFPAARDGRVRQGIVPQRPAQIRVRLRLQYAPSDLLRYPRAAGDRLVVRFRVGQSQLFLQSVPAQRELLRRLRVVRLSSAGG